MHIRRLLLTDFRSCARVDLHPAPGANIVQGANAQGKSTLLEAIYMLATSRSPRAGKDAELIRWGQECATASVEVARDLRAEVGVEISVMRAEKRVMRVNQTRRTKVMELVGQVNAVLFSPHDLDIVRGDPSLRRRFLNLEISQISPQYCHGLLQYRKILEQRNRLLKLMRDTGHDADTLEAWNAQLVAVGSRLIERRLGFVKELGEHAARIHGELAGGKEELQISYAPSFPLESAEGIAEAFQARLAPLARDEVARGVTLLGPHRDELLFLVNGADVKVYGSQGQQRSVVLAAKLAEVELMTQRVGEPPVLLLDDASSELDETRRQHLFALIRGGYQAFVTCTDTAPLPPALLEGAACYTVSAGTVTREALMESVC